MKIFYFFIGAIFVVHCSTYAQSIRVIDSAQKAPVAGAVIIAYDPATQKTVQGATNADGYFAVTYAADHALLFSVSAMGYKKALVKQIQKDQVMILNPDSRQLKEVAIKAASSPVKFNGNVMEYDISQVPNADYLSLTDIIDHLPFLQVVDDGTIKMMNEPLTILIDNKPSIIYKDGSSLRSLPPQAIDKMELTLTPTARNGGKTLNITLKRDYFLGWNGTEDVKGSRLFLNPVSSVSYWRKKYGFDASVNYTYSNSSNTRNTSITYLQQQSTLNSTDDMRNTSNSGRINFSSFYNLNDFDSFDLQFNVSPSKRNTLTNSSTLTQTNALSDQTFSNINNPISALSYNASLNYTHKYRKAGNAFYLLSQFSNSTSNRDQLLSTAAADGSILQDNRFINGTTNLESTIESILQRNSNKKFRYTLGSKLIVRDNKSDNTSTTSNIPVFTPFDMQQLVSSTYADADWGIKKFVVHTGLRFDYNTNNYTEPVKVNQAFSSLTPNISLTYNINSINLLMLTYGRRVTRPYPNTLVPVVSPVNTYQQTIGNENLTNQINNNWGIQYYGNYKPARIGFNFNYSRVTGLIRGLSTLSSDDVIQTESSNVNLNEAFTAGFSADFAFLKKFHFSHTSNYSYVIQRSGIYTTRMWSGYLSDRLSYQVNKQNSIDLSMLTYSPNIDLQGVDQDMAYINWGINYGHYFDLMKKYPSTLSISISNPDHYNGLPGYTTINSPDFALRTDSKRTNAIIGMSLRIQIKGKQVGNRTFNKAKSIQNNDLSAQ